MDIATDPFDGYVASPTWSSVYWADHPIMAEMHTLPAEPSSIRTHPSPSTGRATSSVPETTDFSTLNSNPEFRSRIAESAEPCSRGVAAMETTTCPGLGRSNFLPSEQCLRRMLSLRLVGTPPMGQTTR